MKILTGDMWDYEYEADIILVTTNGVIGANGLIMGRGSAGIAKHKYPGLPAEWATHVQRRHVAHKSEHGEYFIYGLLWPRTDSPNTKRVGAFQTKGHWRDPSRLDIIRYATTRLHSLAERLPNIQIFLLFPGIGNGQLTEKQVSPIIQPLPDNVTIWKYR